tara:strand:+ start:769 stop:1221 length:453 start_codon:yes stop_codon:yes gene_type:complete
MDKSEKYIKALNDLDQYFSGYKLDGIGKMSIISSQLKTRFPHWIFCGFYRVNKEKLLEIGPYQGDIVPCAHIEFSRGVCGKSAREQKTIIVENVNNFPGYIACDDKTVSEIVVPVLSMSELIAVLDIDGAEAGQFDAVDQKYLEEIVGLI